MQLMGRGILGEYDGPVLERGVRLAGSVLRAVPMAQF
jgi:hypothetical protein